MEKKKKMSIIVGLITLVLIITLSTTALWKWTSSNNNVGFTISGLDAYIIYNKGTDVLAGVLDPVANYADTSVSTEITLYKNTSKTLYGHIYLDITTIGSNLANEKALKWVITSNDKVLNQGDFVGSKVGDSLSLKLNIPLSQTEQTFKIYIWLDESMDINDEIEGETLSTIVRAEASEIDPSIQTLTKLGITTINTVTPDFSKVPYITKEQAQSDMTTWCDLYEGADLTSCISGYYDASTFDEVWATGYVSAVDDNGIFESQDDLGTSYYYRGNVENNYVYFAGAYWRIIRINGDGTIRIIYDGPTKKHNGVYGTDNIAFRSEFNENCNDNAYVGYMYGTPNSNYTNTHKNTTNSTVKFNLDKWYEYTIIASGNDKYVADAIYCNDRKISSGTIFGEEYTGAGIGTEKSIYAATSRMTSYAPSLICEQENDKFSTTDIGNGDLTYPVGLITIDEAVMGGIFLANLSSESAVPYPSGYSYLTIGDWYWTMSPSGFGIGGVDCAYVWGADLGIAYFDRVDRGSGGVRPVISLKSDITFTGTGTYDNPFEISG